MHPVKLFYSYSHRDEALRRKLETHLKILVRKKIISSWHDRDIGAGAEWAEEIDVHLKTADIILLLVSADFIASDYIWGKEMEPALERHAVGISRVIPVILRPADWKDAPFGQLQALPKDGRPVVSWSDEDEAFLDVELGIRRAAEEIQSQAETSATRQFTAAANTSGLFAVPQIGSGFVERPQLAQELEELCRTNAIAAVQGLPGAGKTILVAAAAQRMMNRKLYSSILWHNPQLNETVDVLLASITSIIPLVGSASESRIRHLISELVRRQALLIIDDFNSVDQQSYSILLSHASGAGNPLRILLISRRYVEVDRPFSDINRLILKGFTESEVKAFCRRRRLAELREPTLKRLSLLTDGLPFAITLFTTLVTDFGRDPEDLLKGEFENTLRLRRWFDDVASSVGEVERTLLQALSVTEGPFNQGLVRAFCEALFGSKDVQPFLDLQRYYLVTKHTAYRWGVHHLIASFCKMQMTDSEQKARHEVIKKYCLRGLSRRGDVVLEDNHLVWKNQACHHALKAGNLDEAEKILFETVRTAKACGYYESFLRLSGAIIAERPRSWLAYHYAHCCLIIGRFSSGLEVLDPIRYSVPRNDPGKRLMVARLYAELIASQGDAATALTRLREALVKIRLRSIRPQILAHARSIETMLASELGRHREAQELSDRLFEDANERRDEVGIAVAIMRKFLANQGECGRPEVITNLTQALSLFRNAKDRRGMSWALCHYAKCKLEFGPSGDGLAALREALDIKEDIGDCSLDYLRVLDEISSHVEDADLAERLRKERTRVRSVFAEYLRFGSKSVN